MLTFERIKTNQLDGWDVIIQGSRWHDCSLSGLIRLLAECGHLKIGDEYAVSNIYGGLNSIRKWEGK